MCVQLVLFSPAIPVDFKLLWIDTMETMWVADLSATVSATVNGDGAADGAAADGSGGVPNGGDATASATDTTTAANNLIPWGEARLVSAGLRGTDTISVLIDGGNVLEEPGDSDLLDIGPLALTTRSRRSQR